jgi:hypothetical protein
MGCLQELGCSVRETIHPISIGSPNDPMCNHKSGSRLGWVEGSSPYLSFNSMLYVYWKKKSQHHKNNNLKEKNC